MVTPEPDTMDERPMGNRRRWLWVIFLFVLALGIRSFDLGGSGLQNDEQLWHERSAHFIHSILGPSAPDDFKAPKIYWPKKHVDLTDDRFILSSSYPFNIKMHAHHPGIPMGFLIGLSYLFLAEDTSGWSLGITSVIEAGRIPGVLVGSVLVLVVFLLGRHLIGERAAGFASLLMAVEPTIVGYSRLARIDLSGALWATLAVLLFLLARRRRNAALSITAGIFAGLAAATNPYGLFILPALLAGKFLYGGRDINDYLLGPGWRLWRWLDRLDWILFASWAGTFILVYPNLWPNPLLGIYEIYQLIISTSQFKGEVSPLMPISHWFYLVRAPGHLLPWTLLLMFLGIIVGMRRASRSTTLLLIWGGSIIFFLSLFPGRKEFKNFLLVMPVILLFAGMGIDGLISWVSRYRAIGKASIVSGFAVLLVLLGLGTTLSWWPYPQVYTWPWMPDPQLLTPRDQVAGGEGIKEAIAYIRENGSVGDRVAMLNGRINAAYYYDPNLLQDVGVAKYPKGFDWLVSLPKITFMAMGDYPLIRWIRTNEPDHIIRQHQIELLRIYRLDKSGLKIP